VAGTNAAARKGKEDRAGGSRGGRRRGESKRTSPAVALKSAASVEKTPARRQSRR
jgi:hypothetical protein